MAPDTKLRHFTPMYAVHGHQSLILVLSFLPLLKGHSSCARRGGLQGGTDNDIVCRGRLPYSAQLANRHPSVHNTLAIHTLH
jgi:hypothetical protein